MNYDVNMEEVKGEPDFGGMDEMTCVYCMARFTDEEQAQGKVQMFLSDGCFHQFHTECFRKYAKKTLLTKMPNGDFQDCKCAKCKTLVSADDLREALGVEQLQQIRDK